MKKKTIITLITVAVLLLIGIIVTINYNRGNNLTNLHVAEEKKIDANEWKSIKTAKEDEAVKVVWDQKYGERKTEYCKVVFENKKENLYKLVAPWIEIIIERANINDIKFEYVPMGAIPKNE